MSSLIYYSIIFNLIGLGKSLNKNDRIWYFEYLLNIFLFSVPSSFLISLIQFLFNLNWDVSITALLFVWVLGVALGVCLDLKFSIEKLLLKLLRTFSLISSKIRLLNSLNKSLCSLWAFYIDNIFMHISGKYNRQWNFTEI